MSPAETALRRPEHPWLDGFERAPAEELDRLLRGTAVVDPFARADADDVLWTLFGSLPPRAPLVATLDTVLGDWLADRCGDSPDVRLAYGLDRYVRELVDAFAVAYRLQLPATARRLRDGYFRYVAWTSDLVLDSSRDPRAALWRTLALAQPDRALLRVWYSLCDEVGRGRLPGRYLPVAMLGLRYLPRESEGLPEEAATGLARWARHLPDDRGAEKRFRREWLLLRSYYPRAPRPWQKVVAPTLATHEGTPFALWWRDLLWPAGKVSTRVRAPELPPRTEHESLARRLRDPSADVRADVLDLVERHERYAAATGDAYFLVRTACYLGARLRDAQPALALEMARRALRWEPGNAHAWTLWAGALTRLGRADRAEAVYWETLRRFPENEVCRSELAHLLEKTAGREGEAEALLRETMRRFPESDVCRNELAHLLSSAVGREVEAEALLRETIGRAPADAVPRHILGTLLVRAGRLEEAQAVVDGLRQLGAREAVSLAAALQMARDGRAPTTVAELPASPAEGGDDADPPSAVRASGGLSRADFLLGAALDDALLLDAPGREALRADARAELAGTLRSDPNNAYGRLVALLRLGEGAELVAAFPESYGLQLAGLRRERDPGAVRRLLSEAFVRYEPITRLALAATGDEAAHRRLDDWFTAPPAGDPVAVEQLRVGLRRLLAQADTPDASILDLDVRSPAVAALLDDAERASVRDEAFSLVA